MKKKKELLFESNLRLTKEREIDIANLIAECTVVENDLRNYMNNCTKIGATVTDVALVNKYNELKKRDPYYNKIEERKVLVDNCMMNVINNLLYEYDSKPDNNKVMSKISFKRQVKINNKSKKTRCISVSMDKPNTIALSGIGDVKFNKVLRTNVSTIDTVYISRFNKIKVLLTEE